MESGNGSAVNSWHAAFANITEIGNIREYEVSVDLLMNCTPKLWLQPLKFYWSCCILSWWHVLVVHLVAEHYVFSMVSRYPNSYSLQHESFSYICSPQWSVQCKYGDDVKEWNQETVLLWTPDMQLLQILLKLVILGSMRFLLIY